MGRPGSSSLAGTVTIDGLVTTVIDCGGDPSSRGFHNCYSATPWMPKSAVEGSAAFGPLWTHMLTAP